VLFPFNLKVVFGGALKIDQIMSPQSTFDQKYGSKIVIFYINHDLSNYYLPIHRMTILPKS